MKALKVVGQGKAEVQDVDVPKLRDGYILVKVKYAALNPTDWKHIDYVPCTGTTVGCDYMGHVEDVGPQCHLGWKKGDRVAGVVHGCNVFDPEEGSYAEYLLVKEGGAIKVPDNLSDEQAATLGVGVITTGLGLYQTLNLPLPGSEPAGYHVLIYGGSTATGTIAIQFAKLSGAKVITTCSPRNFDLVKSLGAEEAFDYNDPDCISKIRKYTNDELYFVLDCAGGDIGRKISLESISSKGGQLCTIIPMEDYSARSDVRVTVVLAYKMFGEKWMFGQEMPATIEDYAWSQMFLRLARRLLAEGAVKPHPHKVGSGFDGILAGLNDMRQGKVSGQKLVYSIA